MSSDVSTSLAGLCGIATVVSVVVSQLGQTTIALWVAVGVLVLLSLAMVSPAGPQVLWSPPGPGDLQ